LLRACTGWPRGHAAQKRKKRPPFHSITSPPVAQKGGGLCALGRAPLHALQFLPHHKTLRVTPAMASGVGDRLWSV